MKKIIIIIAALLFAATVRAQLYIGSVQEWCQQGGQKLTVGGNPSSQYIQQSYPSCTVTVYEHGTTTLATIYKDENGTPQTNPFTANSDGSFTVYSSYPVIDIQTSGAGMSSPYTYSNLNLQGQNYVAPGTANSIPFYNSTGQAIGSSFATFDSTGHNMTVNGTIQSSSIAAGALPICPNGTGGTWTTSGCTIGALPSAANNWTAAQTFSAGISGTTAAFQQVNSVYDYCSYTGMHCDGVTDDTTAFNSLLQAVYNAGGGIIAGTPGRTSLITGQITLPNDGVLSHPHQAAIRILGAASNSLWNAATASGFTIDDTYNAPVAKILTLGAGSLEISGVNFEDTGTDCAPFIQSTWTTLYIHNNTFSGTATGTAACNDGIVLGGTNPAAAQNSSSYPFQGYGTVIRSNEFSKMRRIVYGRNWSNGVVVEANGADVSNGNSVDGAIVFSSVYNAGYDNGLSGGNIIGNVIEGTNYKYCIYLGNAGTNGYSAEGFNVIGNGCYDTTGSATYSADVAIVGPTAGSGGGNKIIPGGGGGATPLTDTSADSAYNIIVGGSNGLIQSNNITAGYGVTTPRIFSSNTEIYGSTNGMSIVNPVNGIAYYNISHAGSTADQETDFNFLNYQGVTESEIRSVPDGADQDFILQNNHTGYKLATLLPTGVAAYGNANNTTYLHGSSDQFDAGAAYTNGPTPVYNVSGVQQTKGHISYASGSLTSGSATVNWTGSAAFSTVMTCTASDETSASAIKVYNNSGSQVTLTGTGTDAYQLVCVGQ